MVIGPSPGKAGFVGCIVISGLSLTTEVVCTALPGKLLVCLMFPVTKTFASSFEAVPVVGFVSGSFFAKIDAVGLAFVVICNCSVIVEVGFGIACVVFLVAFGVVWIFNAGTRKQTSSSLK